MTFRIGKHLLPNLSFVDGFPTLTSVLCSTSSNGAHMNGWAGGWDENKKNQLWNFQRLSRTSTEVSAVVNANPHIANDLKTYLVDGT